MSAISPNYDKCTLYFKLQENSIEHLLGNGLDLPEINCLQFPVLY